MPSETEYQISLCKACSGSKSNQKLSCNKSTTYCSEIFFNFEKFMNDLNLHQINRCDVLYRLNNKFFLFIELKVQDKFFITHIDEIIGLKIDLKAKEEISTEFINILKTSYEKYTQKYGDIEKEIEFYVVFSSNPLRSKWNIPAISKSQLKKYIREQIFRKIADNKIDLICTINNHDIKLKVCDCDEFMQFIN